MLKQLKRFTLRMIAGANVATILLMLLVGYSDRLDPSVYPKLSNIGLTFPFFVLVNLLFLAIWLLFKKRWALIPLAGMLLGYQPVRNYCPLNLPQTVPDSTLCVVSFNAYNQRHIDDGEFRSEVLDYLRMQQADIVFLQEFSLRQADRDSLADLYPHIDTTRVVSGGDVLTLLSRYPIVGKEHIPTPADDPTVSAYHSAAFLLNIDGDTVCAINNHLESTRLTEQERSDFKKMLKGDMHKKAARQESQLLIDRLGESTEARAPQARYVARYLERCRSVILAGDFNDGPISYVRRTIGQNLTDCYRESGNGLGISYHANAFYVRIDHLMCSDDWIPYECKIDKKITISDHYPLRCKLKKRPKH